MMCLICNKKFVNIWDVLRHVGNYHERVNDFLNPEYQIKKSSSRKSKRVIKRGLKKGKKVPKKSSEASRIDPINDDQAHKKTFNSPNGSKESSRSIPAKKLKKQKYKCQICPNSSNTELFTYRTNLYFHYGVVHYKGKGSMKNAKNKWEIFHFW